MSIADKLTTIAQNEQKVFDAGHTVGYHAGKSVGYQEGNQIGYETGFQEGRSEGYNEGVDIGRDIGMQEGKKAEHDEFWDSYQQNGSRENYYIGFSGNGWTDETFKPKYDIRPTNARQMFCQSLITDLKGILQNLGIILDFSNCINCASMFNGSSITQVGVIDTRSAATVNELFYGAKIQSVEKVILKNDGSQTFNSFTSTECRNLEQIFFEGVIGQDGLNLRWSQKLSKESIESIINALSTTTSGLTVTLSLEAVQKAFETSQEALDGNTSSQWLALIATKPNWTIALIDKNGNKYTFDQDYIE